MRIQANASPGPAEPLEPIRRPAPGRRRGTHGPLQDQAVYNCHCGYVFAADVSTTVDCPHCGVGQAW